MSMQSRSVSDPLDDGADPLSTPGTMSPADEASSPGGAVAAEATDQAKAVAGEAGQQVKAVAGEATDQARAVAGEAKRQFDNVIGQTRGELRQQADRGAERAAGGLRSLGDQVQALADGRTDAAGPLVGYLHDAQGRISSVADRLERGGPQAVLDDVTDFARRRPIVFLAAAGAAGFLVGRLARAGRDATQDGGGSTNGGSSDGATSSSIAPASQLTSPATAELPPPEPVGTSSGISAIP